jgi:3-oxoacyl-[acyl-carrier protein] reductase
VQTQKPFHAPARAASLHHDFGGQVAVITGAGSGAGLHAARAFLASGALVSLWDSDAARLQAAAAELGSEDRVDVQPVDVRDADSVERAARNVLTRWSAIEILVNNAGIIRAPSELGCSSLQDWNDVIGVNLTGVFHCCRAVMPAMAQAGYGRVVNIGSTSGKEGNPFTHAYSAAKAGVHALTKSLGKEYARSGVLVNCLAPTVLDTPMTRRNMEIAPERTRGLLEKIPMGRFGRVEEFAAMLLWLSSPACSFSTGAVFDLSGGRATY